MYTRLPLFGLRYLSPLRIGIDLATSYLVTATISSTNFDSQSGANWFGMSSLIRKL
ncbi:unnamed protein product [Rhodiola kirilowii]